MKRRSGRIFSLCSMSSLTSISTGRAWPQFTAPRDVTLSERLTLVIVARETPLNRIRLPICWLSGSGPSSYPLAPLFIQKGHLFSSGRPFRRPPARPARHRKYGVLPLAPENLFRVKKTNFSTVTQRDLYWKGVYRINNRPGKVLGWKTAQECFAEELRNSA